MQTIAYGDIPRDRPLRDRFIVEEIFPESELPRLADIARAAEMELEIEKVRNDRDDYVKTLRAWFDRLRARRDDAVAVSSEELVARYRALPAHVRLFDGARRVHLAAVDDAPNRFAGTLVAEVWMKSYEDIETMLAEQVADRTGTPAAEIDRTRRFDHLRSRFGGCGQAGR